MSDEPYYTIKVADRDIRVFEPIREKRDRFHQWEYWALKEHMMMKRTSLWLAYMDDVVMKHNIPKKQFDVQEINNRPIVGDKMSIDINMRVPLSKMRSYEQRMRSLERSWREMILYPALEEGLIADFYHEINDEQWPFGVVP